MSSEFVSFGAGLTLRPFIVGLCSLTCGHFKNKTILGLGISLLSYSKKPRSLAGSAAQWGRLHRDSLRGLAGQGRDFPASGGTCLSGPQLRVCSTLSRRLLLSTDCGWQSLSGRRSQHLGGLGKAGCPGGHCSLGSPAAPWDPRKLLHSFQKQTFVLPGDKLVYLRGVSLIQQDKQVREKLPPSPVHSELSQEKKKELVGS